MTFTISGLSVSSGIAIGRAIVLTKGFAEITHDFITEKQKIHEYKRLDKARYIVRQEFDHLQQQLPEDAPNEVRAILEAYSIILSDDVLFNEIQRWISEKNYTAPWALDAQRQWLNQQFEDIHDPYLRERKTDINHIFERLQNAMVLPKESTTNCDAITEPKLKNDTPLILIESDIAPADILHLKNSTFSGFITDSGGKTSHSAIVARSLGIPAIVGTRLGSRLIRNNDWLIIDCEQHAIIVDPPAHILQAYQDLREKQLTKKEHTKALRYAPTLTLDQQNIEMLANIELPQDAGKALEAGAQGVGLFRSEFLFMNSSHQIQKATLPDEETQFQAYKSVVETMPDKTVTIRTIDIGADKPLIPNQNYGSNPALGLRAIRWCLAEPEIFLTQLKALLRASAYGKLQILIPMLTHVWQIQQVFTLLNTAQTQLRENNQSYGQVKIGAMIEVPASVLIINSFIRYFDFLSIGSNDLVQYTLAIDRIDDSVSNLFDALHPAVLKLLHISITQCNAASKKISVCGEMAGDSSMTRLLLGMGLRSFSMTPTQINSVKQEIMRSHTQRLSPLVNTIVACEDPIEQQALLEKLQYI